MIKVRFWIGEVLFVEIVETMNDAINLLMTYENKVTRGILGVDIHDARMARAIWKEKARAENSKSTFDTKWQIVESLGADA